MKRFLLWDFPRGVWQYDVMVALILAFIFLTPREIFRDYPRASNIVRLPAEHGSNVYLIEAEDFSRISPAERSARAEQMLKSRFGRKENVDRVEPLFDSEKEVKGYMAFTKP
jgi:hypothetical protein